jgi:hypothetical protein
MPTNQRASSTTQVPVGGIVPFHKDIDNDVLIPSNFVECNGQTIQEGPLAGTQAPDLNSNNRFLRGNSSSGASGGAEQVAISQSEMASHTHEPFPWADAATGTQDALSIGADDGSSATGIIPTKGSDSAHENRPPYFDVTYIMRVK